MISAGVREGELLPGLLYVRNTGADGRVTCKGELLLDLRYLRNTCRPLSRNEGGELLLGLPYLRNLFPRGDLIKRVNYYLDYRTSETSTSLQLPAGRVNYCLVYRTPETKQWGD